MNYGNIITNVGTNTLPSYKPANTSNWSDDDNFQAAMADGWRHILDTQPVPDGYTVTAWGYTEAGGVYCHEVIVAATNIADAQAAARAARIAATPQSLWQIAAMFRGTLRKYFGDGAETNQTITLPVVMGYFLQIQQGIVTVPDKAQAGLDSQALQAGFQAITQWTMDGTVWSFPWEMLPA